MKFRRIVLVVLLVGGFWYLTAHGPLHWPFGSKDHSPLELTEAHAQPAFDSEEQVNIAVYKKALPTVVNITSTTVAFDFFYGMVPQQGQGSGFVLDKAGHILTNYHVIADGSGNRVANRIEVTLSDKHKYTAQVVGADRSHDLALLKINAPNLQPAVLADSKDLIVGQKVYAIGNPFGLSGTMTRGIISSIRSVRGPQGNPIENAIQTDAAINPGNSGGPLMNSHGEVIGINTMIATGGAEQSSGIGFAIPINTAKAILGDLQKFGRIRRPSLGVVTRAIGPDIAEQMGLLPEYGVLIERVAPGGAAERAGLRGGNQKYYLGNIPIMVGGDLLVGIDGQQVSTPQDISEIMDRHQPGDTITVNYIRGHRKMSTKITLGEAHEYSA